MANENEGFNIENFPDDETAIEIMGMVSPIYDKAYVAKWLFQAIGKMIGSPREIVMSLASEVVPETATWSLPYWEYTYGVDTDESLSYEARRAAVIAKRDTRRAANPARIEKVLSLVSGRDVKLIEDPAGQTIRLVLGPGKKFDMTDFLRAAEELKQSHVLISSVSTETQQEVPLYVGVCQLSIPDTVGAVDGTEGE